MNTLKEKIPRVFYYLLDFNEQDDHKTILENFGVYRLKDLTDEQIIKLFQIATTKDLIKL